MAGSFSTTVTINGEQLPAVEAWDITGGVHGSNGNAEIITSRAALLAAGFDLFDATQGAPSSIPVTISVNIDGGGAEQIFAGEYLSDMWDYTSDTIHVQARNQGGRLVDQAQVLTSAVGVSGSGTEAPGQASGGQGFQTQNQTLSAFVSAIANAMNLTPMVSVASDPMLGAIFGDANTILTTNPQSLWAILTRLADETGNVVYVNNQNQLVFAAPGTGQSLALSWNVPAQPTSPGGVILPMIWLSIVRNPRKNSSFKVKVHSYDHTKGQVTTGTANIDGMSKVQGASPIYTFHADGMTQDQATFKANSLAADIAKRQAVLSCGIDLYPDVLPGQPVTISGDVDEEFIGLPWYVHRFRHQFRMPEGDSNATLAQLETTLSCLCVPNSSSSDSDSSEGDAD